jgi:DNA-binding transcriptional LysR family regulator
MIISAWRLVAVAIATEIGNDQRMVLCKLGRDLTPLHVRLRVAVQQQNRWAIATDKHIDCRAASLDRLASEPRKEVHRASGYGLSEGGRALGGHCPGNYADTALKERTPANRVPARNPGCWQVWTEIGHGNPPFRSPQTMPLRRAWAVARLRVRLAKLHTARMFAWDDLRHFLAFARAGSMQAAAKALGVNQSTVQRRIAELEERVGRRLVERHLGSYRLTELGEELRPAAEGIEAAVAAFERHLAACDKGLTGTIRVTCGSILADRLRRTSLIDAFHARHPGLRVELVISDRFLDLSKGEADIAIRAGEPQDEPWSAARSRRRRGRCMRVALMWNAMVGQTAREISSAISWSPAVTGSRIIRARDGCGPWRRMRGSPAAAIIGRDLS